MFHYFSKQQRLFCVLELSNSPYAMASKVPLTLQTTWIFLIPHLLLILVLYFIFDGIMTSDPLIYAIAVYLILHYLLRRLIPGDHRNGIRLMKEEKFEEAINCFEKSIEFFGKYPWLDKYRYLLILSSAKMSYREMALCNIAFAMTQTNRGKEAKLKYEEILRQYPDNVLAITGLRTMESASNSGFV